MKVGIFDDPWEWPFVATGPGLPCAPNHVFLLDGTWSFVVNTAFHISCLVQGFLQGGVVKRQQGGGVVVPVEREGDYDARRQRSKRGCTSIETRSAGTQMGANCDPATKFTNHDTSQPGPPLNHQSRPTTKPPPLSNQRGTGQLPTCAEPRSPRCDGAQGVILCLCLTSLSRTFALPRLFKMG